MEADNPLQNSVSGGIPSKTHDTPPTEAKSTTDVLPSSDVITPPDPVVEVSAATIIQAGDVTTELVTENTSPTCSSAINPSITPPSPSPSPPALPTDIDVEDIPAFLRSHGKGKREIDIFGYLNQVEDVRFRQVLIHYIRVESNNKAGVKGTLPTSKRPIEISTWSSRARPASLPDFSNGNRTFSDFVDSVFAWWGSIQPSWRSFKRGKISRNVHGEWDTLYAPHINGLLNVVILVYWWVRILEEQKPRDGIRADYEQFADDVAWVFSNLSN